MSNTNAANTNAVTDAALDQLVTEGQEKFAYVSGNDEVDSKDPSPKHEFYAAMITALTGVEVTPKQYQAMILTHRYIQASDLNRARADYRPRTAESVVKASETLLARAEEMVLDHDGAVISKSATFIPTDLAEAVNAKLEAADAARRAKAAELAAQAEAAAEAVRAAQVDADHLKQQEEAEESVSEETFATGGDVEQEELSPKAQLIRQLIELELDADPSLDVEKRERQLNRKSAANLETMLHNFAHA